MINANTKGLYFFMRSMHETPQGFGSIGFFLPYNLVPRALGKRNFSDDATPNVNSVTYRLISACVLYYWTATLGAFCKA